MIGVHRKILGNSARMFNFIVHQNLPRSDEIAFLLRFSGGGSTPSSLETTTVLLILPKNASVSTFCTCVSVPSNSLITEVGRV